jgi:NhaP-type Na+/H+ or K+/H+ antiporter
VAPSAPLAAAAGPDDLETTLLVLGLLLAGGALITGLARRSFLSLTAVFVLAGFALGEGGLDVLSFDPTSAFVVDLATVALIVILFRDGLEVEAEMLQKAWHLPLRKLVLAMPLTAAAVALATHTLTDLSWTESFLVGALLSPTDPVLSSGVVTNPRVPRVVRHSLNLESGLNDGLALPAVLAFSAALRIGDNDFVWWRFVLQDVTLGLVFGVAVGLLAARIMPRSKGLTEGVAAHQKALYALGAAFVAYGVAVLPPAGNGFISVFVCAITLGILRPDIRECFAGRSEDLVELVKLAVFVVFGSLLTFDGLFQDGWAAVAIVALTLFVVRPAAVFIALAGTRLDTATKAFMGWFGPKGVATVAFSLLVLGDAIPGNERIFNLAALAVFCSIILHGLSDTPGSNWLARRSETESPASAQAQPAARGRARPGGALP